MTKRTSPLLPHLLGLAALAPATALGQSTSANPGAAPVPAPPPPPTAPPATQAHEPSLSPLQVTTSTWTRFEGRANYDVLGVSRGRFLEGDVFFYRARLGFRTAPLELTEGLLGLVQFSPQASGWMGMHGTTTENALGVYEGFFRLQSTSVSFDAGRFMMNYGDALVIGNLDWSHTARAFDGFRSRFSLGEAFIDGFVTLATPGVGPAEGYPLLNQPFLGGDSYFWGLYSGFGPLLAPGLELDTYVLGLSNVETPGVASPVDPSVTATRGGATEITWGARVKQKVGVLDYRLEAGVQLGTRSITSDGGGARQARAYQADGELGVSPAPRLRFALNGVVASGDDPNTPEAEGWNDLFPTGHKFLGLMDVIGPRTNVGSGVVKASWGITESLQFLLDAHVFARLQDGGLGQTGSNRLAGYELDAQLVQRLGAPGRVRGLYGVFIPNLGHYASDAAAHYVEIEAGLVF